MPFAVRLPSSLLLMGVCALGLAACSASNSSPELPPLAARVAAWDAWGVGRDSLFRTPDSPLLSADRESFDGLRYFDYDSTLVFVLPLEPALQRDTLRLATSTGEPRDYIRFGVLSFPLDGRRHRLTVFQPTDDASYLFAPFADATNGRDTYSAGRYLDFSPTADGRYVLDFNYAYNPYCVYNPAYSCPFPPAENRLSIAVWAGERLPR